MSDTKPEIHSMMVEIEPPSSRHPGDRFARSTFTLINDVVALCHPDSGVPVQDPHGREYKYALPPDCATLADARIHAGRLTKDFRLVLLGKTKSSERFSRALDYSRDGSIV